MKQVVAKSALQAHNRGLTPMLRVFRLSSTKLSVLGPGIELARFVEQLKSVPKFLSQVTDYLLSGLIAFRVPLAMSLFSYFILSQPAQIRELHLDFGGSTADWIRCTSTIVLLIFLVFSMMVSIEVSRKSFPRSQSNRKFLFLYRGVQVVSAAGIIVGFIHGGYLAFRGHHDPYMDFILTYRNLIATFGNMPELTMFPELIVKEPFVSISLPMLALSACAALLLLFCVITALFGLMGRILNKVAPTISGKQPFVQSRLYWLYLGITIALLAVFASILFTDASPLISLPQTMGSIAIILLFLCLLTAHATAVTDLGTRLGYPLMTLMVGMAVGFSFWNLNDNHAFRTTLVYPLKWERKTIPPDINEMMEDGGGVYTGDWFARIENHLPFLEVAFVDWVRSRPVSEKVRFKGKPYPVFIIAAEGGGIYAATQAAAFLARLYDRCPAISHHLFAISGVSGGSVGASIVAAAAEGTLHSSDSSRCEKSLANQPGVAERAALAILKDDHLAPVVAAGLFPDFLQRFIPYSIPQFDRARALEKSLERSWDQTFPNSHNPFKADFRAHWLPGGNAPMLFLNTTSVETGEQVAISPVQPPVTNASFGAFFKNIGRLPSRYDLPLSTAVGLSARFPGISPAGHAELREGPPGEPDLLLTRTEHFVDGGYIDNSGVETALHIATALRNLSQSGDLTLDIDIDIRLIVIGGSPDVRERTPINLAFKELGPPVTAMLNARAMRSDTAIRRASELYPNPTMMQVTLPSQFFQPPLGWRIRERTVDVISAMIGVPDLCIDLGQIRYEETVYGRFRELGLIRDFAYNSDQKAKQFVDWNTALWKNHCSACEVLHLVRGEVNDAPCTSYGWYPQLFGWTPTGGVYELDSYCRYLLMNLDSCDADAHNW
jgi:hypothetical protein